MLEYICYVFEVASYKFCLLWCLFYWIKVTMLRLKVLSYKMLHFIDVWGEDMEITTYVVVGNRHGKIQGTWNKFISLNPKN